jgi:hypothetical protein
VIRYPAAFKLAVEILEARVTHGMCTPIIADAVARTIMAYVEGDEIRARSEATTGESREL